MPTPRATYRVQLHAGFGFDQAAEIAPYLAELGVSHLYSSPYLQAASGSTHGYDVIDHRRVNSELGGEAAHGRFCRALGEAGLGQVLDIVPNHMAITERGNAWWWDVLENGPASRYASYFDVDWDPPQARLRNTVLLPILGDHYGRVLEAGEISLWYDVEEGFEIRYFEHRLPVAPPSLDTLIGRAADRTGCDDLAFLADALARLPKATATDRESSVRRHRDKEVLRGQLARLAREEPGVAAALAEEVAAVNADVDRLDELLQRQNYQLAFWRRAGRELDYRRFFDVHTLIGLRVEDERVFLDTHARILDWLRRGVLDGVRIDHPDGLYDPGGYLERLRREAPAAWIVVEKILEPGERLPDSWPVAGTTGYDFLTRATGLFVDPAGEAPLTELFQEMSGLTTPWPDLVVEKKHLVLDQLLASDVNRLAEVFLAVCERHRRYRDYTRHELRQALREVAACFPVYRTYARPGDRRLSEQDRHAVDTAIAAASERRGDLDPGLFELLGRLLRLELRAPGPGADSGHDVESELVLRFQQLTGPAMAKGVEDTAFYNFNRLVALNEVGGDPGCFGISPEDFHAACAEAAERWPEAMLATSTHDTKRSEDVRARLALLSEMPAAWGEAVRRWAASNECHRRGPNLPDANIEYLFYQVLVGAWPLPADRAWSYLEKAAREAKAHTSWTSPDTAYEEALRDFVQAALADPVFTDDVAAFVAPLVAPGRVNSLGQTLLKLAAPGVPDLYQGSELWDLSLVDPDNRRPVDYERRRGLLAELAGGLSLEEILARSDEGLPKLWLIRQVLALRCRLPEAFGPAGSYEPLAARGSRASHCFAFARSAPSGQVVAVLPRLVLGLAGDWGETALDLPAGRWRDELTGDEREGGAARISDLLGRFPVALLARLSR
ncbi:MAG TPA: malto-oligosyltrehalose synthase [Thermoanaerobaculia bacterium]|nr:malto-oligosyltrehalose synthase [Thermoanaerobaculia bacterium]